MLGHGQDEKNPGGTPIEAFDQLRSAAVPEGIIKNATFKVYEGAPHGLCTTLKIRVNADLLAFIKGCASRPLPGKTGAINGDAASRSCHEPALAPLDYRSVRRSSMRRFLA
jgi:hypothetical protein